MTGEAAAPEVLRRTDTGEDPLGTSIGDSWRTGLGEEPLGTSSGDSCRAAGGVALANGTAMGEAGGCFPRGTGVAGKVVGVRAAGGRVVEAGPAADCGTGRWSARGLRLPGGGVAGAIRASVAGKTVGVRAAGGRVVAAGPAAD